MISRTSGILVGASLFAFVMFSSCNGMMGKGGSDSASQKEALNKAIAENDEITVGPGGYKISIPKHMSVSKELNDDASLQYQDVYKELYIIVIDEPKTDFIKTFSTSEVNEYDDKLTPEKNYRMVQMKTMKEKMTLRGEPGVKKANLNGLDAEIVDFTGAVEGVESDIYYKLAFVEGTKNLYMIMTWTLASDKEKNSDEMDQMIQSFKLSQ
ncbi:hypothetical protein BH11BAC7_BH11BAC7_06770 [soil metagenome]